MERVGNAPHDVKGPKFLCVVQGDEHVNMYAEYGMGVMKQAMGWAYKGEVINDQEEFEARKMSGKKKQSFILTTILTSFSSPTTPNGIYIQVLANFSLLCSFSQSTPLFTF